jgi:hypothetical protein
MLDKAGIKFMAVNQITSTVDGVFAGSSTNMRIEIRVLEKNAEEAVEINNAIKSLKCHSVYSPADSKSTGEYLRIKCETYFYECPLTTIIIIFRFSLKKLNN